MTLNSNVILDAVTKQKLLENQLDTSGLLLVKLLQGAGLRDALEHVTAAVYEIMLATKNMQEYELQVVAAQDRIAQPEHYFSATQL